jgi:hypothetical protein
MAAVAKNAWMRNGLYKEYIRHGGGMSLLTNQGNASLVKPLQNLGKTLGKISETSELLTRLAIMKRAMENGDDVRKAVWKARNVMDFSQGGAYAKAIDTFIPFFNAALQGLRTGTGAALRDPKTFGIKMLWQAAPTVGLTIASHNVNPAAYKALSTRQKTDYWNFMLPEYFSYRDENGEIHYPMLSIAKDQNIRPLVNLIECMTAKFMGYPFDADTAVESFKALSPATFSSVPTLAAFRNYFSNKDYWLMEDIYKGRPVRAAEEYDKRTHPAYIGIGRAFDMSPMRLQNAVEQIFTRNNTYSTVMGGLTRSFLDLMNPEDAKETAGFLSQFASVEGLKGVPVIRKFLRVTSPYQSLRNEIEEAEIDANTETVIQNREARKIIEGMHRGTHNITDFRTFVKSQDPLDAKRLFGLYIDSRKKDLTKDKFFDQIRFLPADAKARLLAKRLAEAENSLEARQIIRDAKLRGISTIGVMARVKQIQTEREMQEMQMPEGIE